MVGSSSKDEVPFPTARSLIQNPLPLPFDPRVHISKEDCPSPMDVASLGPLQVKTGEDASNEQSSAFI